MNLTPPLPSQNSHAVRRHYTAESKRRVAEIKSWFLCRRQTDQQACDRVSKLLLLILFHFMLDVRTTCMLRRMVWRCAASRSTRRAFWPASSASKHAASVKAAYLMWPCGRLFPAGMRRAIRLTSDLRPVPPEPKEKNTASSSIFLRRLRLRVHSSIEACCCWPFDDGTARRSLYKKLLQYDSDRSHRRCRIFPIIHNKSPFLPPKMGPI